VPRSLKIILTLLGLGAAVGGAAVSAWRAHVASRAIYTDGNEIREPARRAPTRDVLWEPPDALPAAINTPDRDEYEAAVSPDGVTMLFVTGRAGTNADILISRRTAEGWQVPEPFAALNTEYDDLGPAFSPDGRAIYFYSDRPGGEGGYDLWVSRLSEAGDPGWREPTNLGPAVNTGYNEYGPALSPDGISLYFASNRPSPGTAEPEPKDRWPATLREDHTARSYDLYRSEIGPGGYRIAALLEGVNSPFNEGAPAWSPAGDFLYFASDRPGGLGRFDIYRSRLRDGTLEAPQNVRAPVNSPANELDPLLWMQGFALLFSSDRKAGSRADAGAPETPAAGPGVLGRYDLLRSTSREVYREVEPAGLDLAGLRDALWPGLLWLLLLLALLALLLLLLRSPNWRHRLGQLSLLARCILASLLLHALLLLFLAFWQVGSSIGEWLREPGGTRVALVSNATGTDIASQVRARLTSVEPEPAVPAEPARFEPVARTAPAETVDPAAAPERTTFTEAKLAEAEPREAQAAEASKPAEPARPTALTPPDILRPRATARRAEQPEPDAQVSPAPSTETPRAHTSVPDAPTPPPPREIPPLTTQASDEPIVAAPSRPDEAATQALASPTIDAPASTPASEPLDVARTPPADAADAAKAASEREAEVPLETAPGPRARTPVDRADEPAEPMTLDPAPAQATLASTGLVRAPATRPAAQLDPSDSSIPDMPAPTTETLGIARLPGAGAVERRDATTERRASVEVESSPALPRAPATPAADSAPPARVDVGPPTTTPDADAALELPPPGASREPDTETSPAAIDPPAAPAEVAIGLALPEAASESTSAPTRPAGRDWDIDPPSPPAARARAPVDVASPRSPAEAVEAIESRHRIPTPLAALDSPREATPDVPLGARDAAARETPDTPDLPDLSLPESLPALANPYPQRDPTVRRDLVERHGGSEETERAVADALAWLAAHQSADGRWSARRFDDDCSCDGGANYDFDTATTGLALLAFLGANHSPSASGPYRERLPRALDWLVERVGPDGDMRGGESMYSQGIGAIALCEAFAISGDAQYRDAAARAIGFIARGDDEEGGGWRYEPGQAGDTSVLGWQVMALVSARRVGIEVSDGVFRSAERFLDSVAMGPARGFYAYQPGMRPTTAMTAEGMFTRQLLGRGPQHPAQRASAGLVIRELPARGASANTYGWYYATLGLFQHGGGHWETWNEALVAALLERQAQDGHEAGSWAPGDRWSRIGGRIYQTALCTLMLEVYYRYLPLYVTER